MRVSYEEALARGWVSKEDVPKRTSNRTRGGKTPGQRAAEADAPSSRLWVALRHLPGAEQEFKSPIPGRRFRLDVAFPAEKLCVEVDGWEWHGKHKDDFQRDRERQNLLTLHGWRILRFTASDIRKNIEGCVAQVSQALGRENS